MKGFVLYEVLNYLTFKLTKATSMTVTHLKKFSRKLLHFGSFPLCAEVMKGTFKVTEK